MKITMTMRVGQRLLKHRVSRAHRVLWRWVAVGDKHPNQLLVSQRTCHEALSALAVEGMVCVPLLLKLLLTR